MPNYAFECTKCEKKFDFILPLSQSSEVVECIYCGSKDNVRKVFTAVPIKFNGDGFTKDYRG